MKLLLREGCIIRKGANCIIGFPSVGNVGQVVRGMENFGILMNIVTHIIINQFQIAVDHVLRSLVNSSSSQYVGCIESDFILPMAGCKSYNIKISS